MNGRRWAVAILVGAVVVVGLTFTIQSAVVGTFSWRALGLVVIGTLAGVFLWKQQKPRDGDE